jgi:hypothetical protein
MAEPQIGITEATEALCQSVELEKSLSEVVRKDKDGGFGVGHTFDPQITGTLKVLGRTSDTPGSNGQAILSSQAGVEILGSSTVRGGLLELNGRQGRAVMISVRHKATL